MANTIDTKLIADLVASSSVIVGKTVLAPLNAFAQDFSSLMNPVVRGKPMNSHVAVTTSTGSTLKNPTSFNSTTLTLASADVTLDLYSKQIGMAWSNQQSLENSVQKALSDLATDLVAVALGIVTEANGFTVKTADIAGATTADAKDALFEGIYGYSESARKHLVAGSALYGKALPNSAIAFDPKANPAIRGFSGVYEAVLTGDTKGILTDGVGIAVASQVPDFGLQTLQSETVILEGLGIPVLVSYVEDPLATRSRFYTLDVLFGAGFVDTTKTFIIEQSA